MVTLPLPSAVEPLIGGLDLRLPLEVGEEGLHRRRRIRRLGKGGKCRRPAMRSNAKNLWTSRMGAPGEWTKRNCPNIGERLVNAKPFASVHDGAERRVMRDSEWMGNDMRKFFVAPALAMMPVLAMPEAASAATAKPDGAAAAADQEEEGRGGAKAAEARKARRRRPPKRARPGRRRPPRPEGAGEEGRRGEEARERLAMEKKQRAKKAQASASSQRRDCDGFLDCLFGNKPRAACSPPPPARPRATCRRARTSTGRPPPNMPRAPSSCTTPERALYLVTGDGEARRYKVGVGREGFQWSGTSTIVNKAEWPTWRPPQAMIKREAAKGHYPARRDGRRPRQSAGCARALHRRHASIAFTAPTPRARSGELCPPAASA